MIRDDLYDKVKAQYEEKYGSHVSVLKLWRDNQSHHFVNEMSQYTKWLIKGDVLLVGCGCGHQVFGLNSLGFNGYGCDISKFAISHAIVPNCKISDVRHLEYDSKQFLNVVGFDILEHVPLDFLQEAIGECFRVTKKNLLFRIPFADKGEAALSKLMLEDALTHASSLPDGAWEHYINQGPQWWEEQFSKMYNEKDWLYTYIKDPIFNNTSDWHLYRFERR